MPGAAREPERQRKKEWRDPSLDSERESDAAHDRRTEREAKGGEEQRDLREND